MALFDNCDRMWFGTEQKMGWIDTPNTGADVSSIGMTAESNLLTGGAYVRNSWDSHKTYQFSWGESASPSLVSLLQAYRNGSYGRGLIHFHDPMNYETNLLPKRWADPSMAVNFEAEPLIPDVWPTGTPVVATSNNYPVNAATYSVPGSYSSQANSTEHFIPIPEGMSLAVGAVYSGSATLYVRTPGGIVDLLPLTSDAQTVVNTVVRNQPWARLGIRNASGSPASITITGMTARLSSTIGPNEGNVSTFTNHVPNPSFEASSGTAEVYRNRFLEPIPATAAMYAPVRASRTFVTDPSGNYARATVTDTSGVAYWNFTIAANRITASANAVFQYRIQARSGSGSPGLTLRMYAMDSSGNYIGQVGSDSPTYTGSDWGDLEITGTMPVGTVYVGIYVVMVGTPTMGATMDVRKVYAGAPIPYYMDGSFSPDPELTPSWVGTANASESILSGAVPVGVGSLVSPSGQGVRSSEWFAGGSYSLRVVPRSGSNADSWAGVGGDTGAMRLGMVAGQTYTVLATGYLKAPLPVTSSRRIRVFYRIGTGSYASFDSPQVPNVAGEAEVRMTFTLPVGTTEAFVRLYNGSLAAQGDIWWDNFALVDGEYTGSYFDGNTPGAVWNGAPNASTSTLTVVNPVLGSVGSGPWMSGEGHSGCRFVGNPTVVNYNGVDGGQLGLSCILREVGAWV